MFDIQRQSRIIVCIAFGTFLRLNHLAVPRVSAYAYEVCLNTNIDGVSE